MPVSSYDVSFLCLVKAFFHRPSSRSLSQLVDHLSSVIVAQRFFVLMCHDSNSSVWRHLQRQTFRAHPLACRSYFLLQRKDRLMTSLISFLRKHRQWRSLLSTNGPALQLNYNFSAVSKAISEANHCV